MLLYPVLLVPFISSSMICPSCLMFDGHKGHEVCKIEEGAKDLRNKINDSARVVPNCLASTVDMYHILCSLCYYVHVITSEKVS